MSEEIIPEMKKEIKKEMKHISYSQLKLYLSCNLQWANTYIRKLSPFTDNIYTIFGTAMHETVEAWIKVIYEESAVKANRMELKKILKAELTKEYLKCKEKRGGEDFLTSEELYHFWKEGAEILDFLMKKRGKYFKKKGIKLLGIEDGLEGILHNNIKFQGIMDIVLEDTVRDKIIIIDLKTSTHSWGNWKKKDDLIRMQLVLYKYFYAQQFNVDISKIEVQYFIMKRKIYENSDFPQPRAQVFSPPSGKPTVNKFVRWMNDFVTDVFTPEGEYIDKVYPITGNEKNCRFCPFKNTEHCPR